VKIFSDSGLPKQDGNIFFVKSVSRFMFFILFLQNISIFLMFNFWTSIDSPGNVLQVKKYASISKFIFCEPGKNFPEKSGNLW